MYDLGGGGGGGDVAWSTTTSMPNSSVLYDASSMTWCLMVPHNCVCGGLRRDCNGARCDSVWNILMKGTRQLCV